MYRSSVNNALSIFTRPLRIQLFKHIRLLISLLLNCLCLGDKAAPAMLNTRLGSSLITGVANVSSAIKAS